MSTEDPDVHVDVQMETSPNVIDRLARIEVKLDTVLKVHQDHEARLRAVERWKYALPVAGFTAASSVVLSLFGIYGK